MCGKGVGLGLFPSEVEKWPFLTIFGLILAMFLTSQPYDFDVIAHIGLIWCRTTVENFVRIVWTVFEKIEKSRKMAVFWPFLG